jgi:FAD/FMN-containing dehydrogenase
MKRRDLLRTAALLPLSILSAKSAHAEPTNLRRVRPDDPAWPGLEQWAGLRAKLAGDLIKPQPLLASCVADRSSPDCAEALKHLTNPYYIGDQVSGTQLSGWHNAWTPQPSAYAVVAKSESDVVAAVNFARRHSLRLVVKGGGHSYLGTSNAADSLLVWTRHMNAISVHDSFVAQGCAAHQAPCTAVTVQAGAIWMDAYDAVTSKAGRYVQGGGCTTVGVAGLIQSGGFGSFSKGFGTAAGSLLEARIVTADGKLRVVNACQDADLFWALKGGGGGSFGIATQLTLQTYELPEFFGGAQGIIQAASDEDFRRLLARFVEFYAEQLLNAHWGETVRVSRDNTLQLSMVCQGISSESAARTWEPFFSWVAASPSSFKITQPFFSACAKANGWWDPEAWRRLGLSLMRSDDRDSASPTHGWWREDQDQVGMYLHAYDSIWLPASLLTTSGRQRLTDALFASSRQFGLQLHFNKGLAGAPGDAIERTRDTAMNPAVLHSFALVIIATGERARYPGLPDAGTDDTRARANASAIEHAMLPLRAVAPAAGSYVSESNYFNAIWEQAYWGANATQLKRVKAKYDPTGLFFVHHGVGSDQWSADGFVRRAQIHL